MANHVLPAADAQNPYKAARVRSKMTVAEVAKALGLTASYLYKVERGDIQPSRKAARSLADLLNMGGDQLPSFDQDAAGSMESTLESLLTANAAYVGDLIAAIRCGRILDVERIDCELPDLMEEIEPEEHHLRNAIATLIRKQTLNAPHGYFDFLWTGRNYTAFTPFYESLYDEDIARAVLSGVAVSHYVRDGVTSSERRLLVRFLIEKLRKLRPGPYRNRVVRGMLTQPFVGDLYTTSHEGAIFTLSGHTLYEASLGLYTHRRRETLERYFSFLEQNSEERVLYYHYSDRRKFRDWYWLTESRKGNTAILQKMLASCTRPLSDYDSNSKWGQRTLEYETKMHGIDFSINDLITKRRVSTQIFRDRLKSGNFRQILSFETIDDWIESGKYPHRDKEEGESERISRLKNVINLMDETNGNFRIALVSENRLQHLGWSSRRLDDISWLVHSERAVVFEGEEAIDGIEREFFIVVSDEETCNASMSAFDDTWRDLTKNEADQRKNREYLVSKVEKLERRLSSLKSR